MASDKLLRNAFIASLGVNALWISWLGYSDLVRPPRVAAQPPPAPRSTRLIQLEMLRVAPPSASKDEKGGKPDPSDDAPRADHSRQKLARERSREKSAIGGDGADLGPPMGSPGKGKILPEKPMTARQQAELWRRIAAAERKPKPPVAPRRRPAPHLAMRPDAPRAQARKADGKLIARKVNAHPRGVVDLGTIHVRRPNYTVVARPMNGVIDMRGLHIKAHFVIDDPENKHKKAAPDKLIGKNDVKVIGGSNKGKTSCNPTGGNTIYGSHLTIYEGDNDISGEKYCMPGAGIPGSPGRGQSLAAPSPSHVYTAGDVQAHDYGNQDTATSGSGGGGGQGGKGKGSDGKGGGAGQSKGSGGQGGGDGQGGTPVDAGVHYQVPITDAMIARGAAHASASDVAGHGHGDSGSGSGAGKGNGEGGHGSGAGKGHGNGGGNGDGHGTMVALSDQTDYASQQRLQDNYDRYARGPVNTVVETHAVIDAGPEPSAPVRALHLPTAPENYSHMLPGVAVPKENRKLVDSPLAHHGNPPPMGAPDGKNPKPTPFVIMPRSLGSHSANGNIAWAPEHPAKPSKGIKKSHAEKPAGRLVKGKGKKDGGGDGTGLLGTYYSGPDFEHQEFRRPDRNIDFVWTGMKVDPRMPFGVAFSVRWLGKIVPRYSETYTIYTASDDGVRVWIDGKLLIANWTIHGVTEDVGRINLVAGHEYPIKIEYFEKNGLSNEIIKLYWESPSQPKEYIPEQCLKYPKPEEDSGPAGAVMAQR